MNWAERSRQAVWHPCTQMKVHEQFPPRAIVSAEGPWLIDDQGHRILDAVSSWWVNLFGHNFAPIREAITDQLGRLDHIMLAGGSAPLPGLTEAVTQQTGFACSAVNPFDGMEIGSSVRLKKMVREAPSYLTSCGLAMRRFLQ